MSALRIVLGALAMRLRRLSGSGQADRIAEHLRWIVHPNREDWLGALEAQVICSCTARKICAAFESDRLDALEAELSRHVSALSEYMSQGLRQNIDALLGGGPSGYPVVSDMLGKELEVIAPSLQACEEAIGGDGVEF